MNQDWKPVPKVYASTFGALVASITVAVLVRYGWTDEQASTIAPAVADAVIVMGPPLVVLLFGYVTPDKERESVKAVRKQADEGDDQARVVIEYLKAVSKSDDYRP